MFSCRKLVNKVFLLLKGGSVVMHSPRPGNMFIEMFCRKVKVESRCELAFCRTDALVLLQHKAGLYWKGYQVLTPFSYGCYGR